MFIASYVFFPFLLDVGLQLYLGILNNNYFWIHLGLTALCLPLFFANRNYKKIITWSYFALFYLPTIIDVLHIFVFGGQINIFSIKAILDTNPKEAAEFIVHFSNVKSLLFLTSIIGISWFLIKKVIKYRKKHQLSKLWNFAFFVGFAISCFTFSTYKPTFLRIVLSCASYYQELDFIRQCKEKRPSLNYGKISSFLEKDVPQTYVIIIGESATRDHLSLYGYSRKTTPLCDSIKNELHVFDNIQSAHCQTLLVLQEALVLDDFSKGDVISFFKQAGFKTFWLSTQFNGGHFDNLIAIIAQQADVCKFITSKDATETNGKCFDELLIPHFQNALNDTCEKKVIFLHLIGSHAMYENRYPKSFKYFSDNSCRIKQTIAEYDNSIAYTDSIIYKCIQLLKKQQVCSYLLYLSDHGEDVRDADDCCFCHTETSKTPMMSAIPFFVWTSEKYKSLNKDFIESWDLHRHYKTNNLTHSILDLSRFKNENIDKNKSAF